MNDEQKKDERTSEQIAHDIINEVKGNEAPAPKAQETPPAKPAEKPAPTPKTNEPPSDTLEVPGELFGEKPKAKSEPKQAAMPEEDQVDLKKADKRTQEAFQRLRTQLQQANEQLEQAKASKVAGAPLGEVVEQEMQTKKQIEEMTAKLNQAYDEIGKYSLSADPRFRAQYEGPQKAIIESIKDIAKDWDVKDEVIQSLLKASPKQRLEILNENAPDIMPMIAGHLANYDHIEKMKQIAIERHNETKQALETQQQQQSEIMNKTGREALFKNATLKVLKDGYSVFQPVEGNDAWNQHVAMLHKQVVGLFSGNDQLAQAEHLVKGVAAPVYLKLYQQERAKRIKLESDMKARYEARGGLDAEAPDAAGKQKAKVPVETKDIISGILSEELK